MRVTIFDYGAGNLHSLAKAAARSGVEVVIEPDPVRSIDTDVLFLPGVGAFGAAAAHLAPGRVAMRVALECGLPCLAVCLGMQLLLDESEESPASAPGLGLIPGKVTRLHSRRVPQIGWNSIDDPTDRLFIDAPLSMAYYANGYVCRPSDESGVVRAWSVHDGDRFPAMVRVGRTVGVQFHPEKSSGAGVRFLHAFLEEAGP